MRTMIAAVAMMSSFAPMAAGTPSLTVKILDGVRLGPDATHSAMPPATIEQTTLDRRGGELSQVMMVDGGQLTVTAAPGSDALHRKLTVRFVKEGVDGSGQKTRDTVAINPRSEVEIGRQIALGNDRLPYSIGICIGVDGQCPDPQLSLNR